jgi:DNA-binding transcriptional ArsR family regulator
MGERTYSDALFLAIAHPVRRAMLERIADRDEVGVSELRTQFTEMTFSALSQHLKVLKDAGLIADRRDGRAIFYHLTPEPLFEVIQWMQHFQSMWQTRLDKLGQFLEQTEQGDDDAPTV